MSKQKVNRKRKHEPKPEDFNNDNSFNSKQKFRAYNERARAEEEHLSHILFGGTGFLRCLEEAEQEAGPSQENSDSGVGEDDTSDSGDNTRKPAWTDEDDGIEVGEALNLQRRRLPAGGINSRTNMYSNLLKNKFQSAVGTPKWASITPSGSKLDYDSDDEILQTSGFLSKSARKSALPATQLEFKRVKDVNFETYSEGPGINSVEFHETSSVALVAGSGQIVSLFAVDGKRNNKLHSIAFQYFPILCAKFAQGGNEIILGSREKHIFSYDLLAAKALRISLPEGLTQFKNFIVSPDSRYIAAAGKWGEVHVLDAASKERIALLKQDSKVTALTYNPIGNLLFGHSDTSEVTVWDMNMYRVKHKFTDEGCLQGTTLAISSTNQFLAAGSAQGVVNLYGMEDVLQNKLPKPRKTILNLTTEISDLQFNPSSEILAFCSPDIKSSVKLFHIGSGTVFGNFPTFGTKLGNVNKLNFSPGSGYIAFGTRDSIVPLYRLKHFKNY